MVDIPTLNKSVNEFRALIQSNNERTQRAEERKKKAALDAQKKLENTVKEDIYQIEIEYLGKIKDIENSPYVCDSLLLKLLA